MGAANRVIITCFLTHKTKAFMVDMFIKTEAYVNPNPDRLETPKAVN